MRYDMKQRWGVAAWLVVAVVLPILAVVVEAQDGDTGFRDPRVFPPASLPFGKGYSEWSAEWWQWTLSIPASENPLLDETGEKCVVGQHGPVWFLTAVLNVSGIAIRRCSVPEGIALFFPILNTEAASPLPPNPPSTVAELRDFVRSITDLVTDVLVEIDEIPIRGLEFFRFASVVFSLTLTQTNVLLAIGDVAEGTPGTYFPAVDDGFYVMLKPLPVGEHTLHIHGESPSFNFVLDITYHLTVVPLTRP